MAGSATELPTPRKPLRLWPGVAAVVVQWVAWIGVPAVAPGAAMPAMLVALALGPAVVVWWLFFSRAAWSERLGALVLMVAAVAATKLAVHPSLAGGMMGMLVPIYAIPALSLALVGGLLVSRRGPRGLRIAATAGAILLACGSFLLLRTGGITGDTHSDFHWRWSETPEEALLARVKDEPPPIPAAPPPVPAVVPVAKPGIPRAAKAPEPGGPVWSGFRGPERDNVVRGVQIETDWSKAPPVAMWKRAVGPGWSSFAVQGNLAYTQEQRGEEEVVSCYNLATGDPVWVHRDAARFWESNAGAGPRGTPTLHDGRVYTLGATGIVNALDSGTGAVIWSRNAATDTGAPPPGWGFSGSPLVVDDVVIAAASGRLAAYDRASGNVRWTVRSGGSGYSSPHLATVGGVAQVLFLHTAGAISVAPADGTVLWKHAWPGDGMVQPAVVGGSDVLMGSAGFTGGAGVRRITVTHGPRGWDAVERWTSAGLKPYYNDFIVHKGHAFGFDGSILACIDLADGKRKWKGGRYGHGQLVVLPDQDVLLVLSEEGELALVAAAFDKFTELARLAAIEGKTWNHPVLAGDVLLVRNSEQMAAFRMSRAR